MQQKKRIRSLVLLMMGSIAFAQPSYCSESARESRAMGEDAKFCCQAKTLKETELSDPLEITDSDMCQEITEILSKHFGVKIQIESIIQLSEPERRNLILRIRIQNPAKGAPKSVIFKQTLKNGSSEEDKNSLRRFSQDWAGLEFLSNQKYELSPRFYGGSLKNRFILLEDLGNKHVSLVDSLTSNNPKEAEAALYRFMKCLGRFHAAGYGKTQDYFKLLNKLDPYMESLQTDLPQILEKLLPKFRALMKELVISESEDLWKEIKDVFKANLEPGPFTTLVHGDICPDNVFDSSLKHQMVLIDFEHAVVGSALLDGTYLRMSMPTCWCAKTIPLPLIQSLEKVYKEELIKKIPAAKDRVLYDKAYVHACAFWMLQSVLTIQNLLEKDDVHGSGPTPQDSLWRPEENRLRPRVLSRLQSFMDVAKDSNHLPQLRTMAEQILSILKNRWPEANPMDAYPAFKK